MTATLLSRSVDVEGAQAWAASGLDRLTGAPGRPARPVRDHLAAVDALLRKVEGAAAKLGARLTLDLDLLTERARELGLSGQGRTSCNGSARMLRTSDGWAVVNLARLEDEELVPAWIGGPLYGDPWAALARHARACTGEAFVETGRLLGAPTSVVCKPGEVGSTLRGVSPHPSHRAPDARGLLVVDLSALWAGPLCGALFTAAGARVIKVESTGRPDAMRQGAPRLFAKLHAGQASVVLDFASADGRTELARLIATADVVIEASRPRALRQLGIDAEAWLMSKPGATWISITAYGRAGEQANWIGFGDDVAASAGLVALDVHGQPAFLGDAIADPIAGLTAAWLGMEAVATGGGMVALSMHAAAAAIADAPPLPEMGR